MGGVKVVKLGTESPRPNWNGQDSSSSIIGESLNSD